MELEEGSELVVCESCEWAKTSRKVVAKTWEGERCKAVGDEIYTDLWGPTPVESIAKKKYYISFTDDHSRYTSVFFLCNKDEASNYHNIFEAWLSMQHNIQIKCLNSDRGGKFISDEFSDDLKKARMTRRLTIHDTPEHNGISERGNCTDLELVCAMLHDSGLPKFLWPDAVSLAVYIRNCTWARAIGETTPYKLLNGLKLNIKGLQPWGFQVRVHDSGEDRLKLESCLKIGCWLGFDPDMKDNHRIYWPEKWSVSIERSVKFNFNDEEFIRLLPTEGEIFTNTSTNTTTVPEKPNDTPITEEPEPVEGRGKQVWKESKLVIECNVIEK